MTHPLLETHKKDIPRTLDPFLGLWFGQYGSFKTFLIGSMLQEAINAGKSALFLNIQGEDGEKTLLNFPDVPSVVIVARDYKDIKDVLQQLEAKPVYALGVDSGTVMGYEFQKHFLENFELPADDKTSVGRWSKLHHYMRQTHTRLRRCATRVALACPVATAAEETDLRDKIKRSEMNVTPSYPGREKNECVGWVDYVGYCEVVKRGAELERKIHFEPSQTFLTKARLLRPMVKPVRVPEGPGAWASVEEALNRHLTMEGTK